MRVTDTSPFIRRGHRDEAMKLAELHVEVWRATYGDLAPKRAIELLDQAKRLPYWKAATAETDPGRGVWVAEDGADILGVVSIGSSDLSIFQGRAELKHLYVANGAQGQGLGEKLFEIATTQCKVAGDSGLGLAVVQKNKRARSFYQKMGGVEVSSFIDPGPLWQSENILVVWDFPAAKHNRAAIRAHQRSNR